MQTLLEWSINLDFLFSRIYWWRENNLEDELKPVKEFSLKDAAIADCIFSGGSRWRILRNRKGASANGRKDQWRQLWRESILLQYGHFEKFYGGIFRSPSIFFFFIFFLFLKISFLFEFEILGLAQLKYITWVIK